MNWKKIFIRDEQKESIKIIEAWEVRWTSRHGVYAGDTKPEVRLFPSEEQAIKSKQALIDAFSLIKQTSQTKITIIGQSYD